MYRRCTTHTHPLIIYILFPNYIIPTLLNHTFFHAFFLNTCCYRRAKAAAEKKAAAAAAAAEAALYDFPPTPEAAPCSSLFIPSQNEIFPPDPVYYIEGVAYPSPPDPVPRQVSNLSDLQIVELVETYRYVIYIQSLFIEMDKL